MRPADVSLAPAANAATATQRPGDLCGSHGLHNGRAIAFHGHAPAGHIDRAAPLPVDTDQLLEACSTGRPQSSGHPPCHQRRNCVTASPGAGQRYEKVLSSLNLTHGRS